MLCEGGRDAGPEVLCWGHALPCRPLRECPRWTPSTAGVLGCGEGGPRRLGSRCGHSAFLGASGGPYVEPWPEYCS